MKKLMLILSAFAFVACSRYDAMTQERFSDISSGTSIATIEKEFGKPISVRSIGKKQQVYEYVEKITMGTQVVQQRNYFFLVSEGKVVGKYIRYYNPPPYEAIYSDDIFPDNQ